jgi:hypothetical protein
VIASDAAQVDGAIRAGGPRGGGFVETSGFVTLAVGDGATVDPGAGGAWLLDPRNVLIADAPLDPTFSLVDPDPIVAALNGGASVTVTTTDAAAQDGDLWLAAALSWTGDGDLRLVADRDMRLSTSVVSRGDGGFTAEAGRDLATWDRIETRGAGDVALNGGRDVQIGGAVEALGSGSVAITAATGDVTNWPGRAFRIGTVDGDVALSAPEGSILLKNRAPTGADLRIDSASGDVTLTADDRILLSAGEGGVGEVVRVGNRNSAGGDVRLSADKVDVFGGDTPDAFAEVAAGPGGSLTIEADERIWVRDGAAYDTGRIRANGADLRLSAPEQKWDGHVRAAALTDGVEGGGSVELAGRITAYATPWFDLAPGENFVLEPATPGGAPSSYFSTQNLRVVTRGEGTIDVGASATAKGVYLFSEAGVRLGPDVAVEGTTTEHSPIVIAAGREFRNEAGSDVFTVPDGTRWRVYIDTFAGMVGDEPGPREFDLYGRPFAENVALSDFGGNRIVYAERPVLVATAQTLSKTYGETVDPGATVTGVRPTDALAALLATGPDAESAGAPATADVGTYATTPIAALSARAATQGYDLRLVAGVLTVDPAALTVTADDAARTYGAANPAFTASFDGFVNGEGVGDLDGALAFLTGANAASPVGTYAVTPQGLTSGNYAIVYMPGTLTVDPAALTVTTAPSAKFAGEPNPAFQALFDGFVNGEGIGDLQGALAFATKAGVDSPPGEYDVTPEGLVSGNYTISFVPGILVVGLPDGPTGALAFDRLEFGKGVPPLTVGDASFRTTVGEAGPSVGDPFALTYSLGLVVQQAPGGFAPAGAEGGFAPAGAASDEGLGCGGPVNLGAPSACARVEVRESYWTTRETQ